MEMDRKKKGVLLLTVAGGVVVILLAILFIWSQSPSGRMGSGEERNVYIDVQNAEEKPMEESKIKSYRSGRSNIEDYWDEVGEELDARGEEIEDPMDVVSGRAQDGAGRRGPRTYTAEDVFGGAPSPARTQEPPASPSRPDAAERRAMYQKERQAAIDEVIRRQEERMRAEQEGGEDGGGKSGGLPSEKEEPRDRIDVDRVMVRRSGSVTTMEEGFSTVTTSGVSSLDGDDEPLFTDEAYPFKCMFVRSGKLKSGERVSVRLLEDMVIDGQLVPRNTPLLAVCSIGSRLDLNVASIDLGGKIINLDYDAYDNDGTKGIYCPGISDKTTSKAAGTAVSGARGRLTSRVGRAAQDVVNTGLSLITLSGDETAVQVPAGYQFYLVKSKRK